MRQNRPKREEDDCFDAKEFRDWTSRREFFLHAAVEQHKTVEGPLHDRIQAIIIIDRINFHAIYIMSYYSCVVCSITLDLSEHVINGSESRPVARRS